MTTNDIISTAREYRELQAMIKDLENEADALKQTMIREMDNRQVEKLAAGEYEIRYQLVESSRLDTSALKKALPDIAAQFTKLTTSTRFQVA